jgi:phosphohistidine phosphatase SixA
VLARFARPPGADDEVTVWLVRHARAGDRLEWKGDDRARPLVRSGWKQADAIAALLKRRPLCALHSSPWVRCTQTLEPLAARRDLAVRTSESLGEGSDPLEALAFLADEARSGPLAASTHGDVMMQGVENLLASGTKLRGGTQDYAKGCLWELVLRAGRWKFARHHDAP